MEEVGDAADVCKMTGEVGRERSSGPSIVDGSSAAGWLSVRTAVDAAGKKGWVEGGWEVVGREEELCADVDAAAREVAAEVKSVELGVLFFDGVCGPCCCGAVTLFGFSREVCIKACCLERSFAAVRAAFRDSSCSSLSSLSSSISDELEWVKGEGIKYDEARKRGDGGEIARAVEQGEPMSRPPPLPRAEEFRVI